MNSVIRQLPDDHVIVQFVKEVIPDMAHAITVNEHSWDIYPSWKHWQFYYTDSELGKFFGSCFMDEFPNPPANRPDLFKARTTVEERLQLLKEGATKIRRSMAAMRRPPQKSWYTPTVSLQDVFDELESYISTWKISIDMSRHWGPEYQYNKKEWMEILVKTAQQLLWHDPTNLEALKKLDKDISIYRGSGYGISQYSMTGGRGSRQWRVAQAFKELHRHVKKAIYEPETTLAPSLSKPEDGPDDLAPSIHKEN